MLLFCLNLNLTPLRPDIDLRGAALKAVLTNLVINAGLEFRLQGSCFFLNLFFVSFLKNEKTDLKALPNDENMLMRLLLLHSYQDTTDKSQQNL